MMDNQSLFINIQTIITNEETNNILNTFLNDNEYYNELNENCNIINNKILEKRHKSNPLYFKPSQHNTYNNSYNNSNNSYNNSNNTNYNNTNYNSNYYNKKYNKNNKNKYYKNKYKNYNNEGDDMYLTLNRNLNKLSINNFDTIMGSNLESMGMYIVNELTEYLENYNKFFVKFRGEDNMIQNFNYQTLFTTINKYVNHILLTCFKKSLIQHEHYRLYFKYIQSLQNVRITSFRENIIKRITFKLNEIISINNENKTLNETEIETINTKLTSKVNEFKQKINSEINIGNTVEEMKTNIKSMTITFLKYNSNKEQASSLELIKEIEKLIKNMDTNVNIDIHKFKNEVIFNLIGYFNKYFGNFNSSNNASFNEYLLSIYENFKNINELLLWEPINIIELENRISFTIGFLENNSKFIKCLDYDFFQDIESELETIKKSKNIPTTVKYKLLDTIDNFIQSRYEKH